MDIYIQRDGAQIGPFSEETAQRLLDQGTVLATDLAWRDGLAEWISLQKVLEPEASESVAPAAPAIAAAPPKPPLLAPARIPITIAAVSEPEPEPEPPAAEAPKRPSQEPASARQKAFLSYMGISYPSGLEMGDAAFLINEVMDRAKDPARLAKWNEDRLRLHPELFAAEVQAKKENRPARFFELAETDGAECFDGLSKAYCQVLVGYLDVKFPNWDANETTGAWNYFFPAIAEKFPDVVVKEWRAKLKYPKGPKIAAELKSAAMAAGKTTQRRPSPVAAMLKGLGIGTFAVGLMAGALYVWQNTKPPAPEQKPVAATGTAASPSSSETAEKEAKRKRKKDEEKAERARTELASTQNGQPSPADRDSQNGSRPSATTEDGKRPSAPKPPSEAIASSGPAEPSPSTPAESAPASPPKEMARTQGDASLDALFGTPSGAVAATPPVAGAPARKADIVLTKAIEVSVPFGKAKLPAGTHLRLVSQEGGLLKVNYLNQVVSIPANCTDVGSGEGQ